MEAPPQTDPQGQQLVTIQPPVVHVWHQFGFKWVRGQSENGGPPPHALRIFHPATGEEFRFMFDDQAKQTLLGEMTGGIQLP